MGYREHSSLVWYDWTERKILCDKKCKREKFILFQNLVINNFLEDLFKRVIEFFLTQGKKMINRKKISQMSVIFPLS